MSESVATTLATIRRWADTSSDTAFYDNCGAAGVSDGLPMMRPTSRDVEAFLAANGVSGSDIVASIPPMEREATAEALATCAIMAGCRPAHFRVLHACVRALSDPELNARGVLSTTGSATFAIIVNGPARIELDFNFRANCLGPGNRSNATVGRTLSLITHIIGGALPGLTDMATMGQPAKYTFCFAENEDESPWDPLHVERGFARGRSTVTLVGVSGTVEVVNSHSRDASELIETMATAMASPSALCLGEALIGGGQPLVLITPEWGELFGRNGLTKSDVQQQLYDRAVWPADRLPRSIVDEMRRRYANDGALRVARDPADILLVIAGGVGVKQTFVPNWSGISRAVTRAI